MLRFTQAGLDRRYAEFDILIVVVFATDTAMRDSPTTTNHQERERVLYCQPTGPNPLYHRDDEVVRPRAMGV